MAMSDARILIIGCGPGAREYVSPAARSAAASADVLLGAQRLLDLFDECKVERIAWNGHTKEMLATLAQLLEAGRRPGVLVSGDPGIFSAAKGIVERFGAAACRIIPAVSSVQVAFARLGLQWVDAKIISAHGRTPSVTPTELACCDKVAILAGTPEALAWCDLAACELAQTHNVFVCENLTAPDERVRRMEPSQVASCGAASLAIVLLVRKELLA